LNYPLEPLPLSFVEALGIRTGYYSAGEPNDRPVLLLHGMSTSADSFREIMHGLAPTHWLIAPDLPGFGYSDNTSPYNINHLAEWLAAFKAALHLPAVALVGHSFGGALATSFALWYPEDVNRLLLQAPAILTGQNYPELLKKIGLSLGLVELGTAVTQSKFMVNRQIRTPFYDPEQMDPSIWERRLADYSMARASASVVKAAAFHDVSAQLSDLTHPVALVWGREDGVVSHSDADELESLLPNCEVHKLEKCGHVPMLEQPAQLLTIARNFLV
jgi:pimeloyl-ACP methyl ester carboxylesterase